MYACYNTKGMKMDTIMSGLETRVCNFHFPQRCTARARLGEIIKLSSQSFCGFLASYVSTHIASRYISASAQSITFTAGREAVARFSTISIRSDFFAQISIYLLTYVLTQFLRFESATYLGLQTIKY